MLAVPVTALANPVQIELNNGDVLTAELLSQTEQKITISHQVLGEVSLDKSKVATITEMNAAAPVAVDNSVPEPTQVAEEVTDTAAPTDNGLFNTGLLTNWERRFDLGVAGSAGKSRNMQVNAGFAADYDSDYTRISSKTAYFSASSDGERTDNSFYSSINRDWLRPETPWFHFAGGRVDLDEFKDWDYRINGNGGFGYEFYNTDNFLFVGRTGLGFSQTFGGEREEFTPEGLLGLETKWKISEYQRIHFANTLYPNLKDSSEFRNLSSFDWVLDLNSYAGVALKVGLLNEYDSATEEGISKNDFKYTVSLSWSL